jgi:hypothetical protein
MVPSKKRIPVDTEVVYNHTIHKLNVVVVVRKKKKECEIQPAKKQQNPDIKVRNLFYRFLRINKRSTFCYAVYKEKKILSTKWNTSNIPKKWI